VPADQRFTRLAIIVVNYGSSELLAENLAPLAKSTGAAVVVFDNFTTAAERDRLVQLAGDEGWTTVLGVTNLGFGVGINRGVERARELGATEFLILNPDATLEADAVAELVAVIEKAPLTLVSPTILRPDGSTWFAGSDLYLADGRIRSRARRGTADPQSYVPWLSGCCLAVTDELWARVGGFDEEFFLYWEDVDLSRRVVEHGGDLMVSTEAIAVHAEGGTQQRGGLQAAATAKSPVYYYYNIRNRLLFAARHLEGDGIRAWLSATRAVSWEILLQGGRRQFLSPVRPLRAWRRAIRDGRRIAQARLRQLG
jgi:GT2 family glycosyltransferase